MRSRNINSAFFTSSGLLKCEPLARILFEGLWCMADRAGRLKDDHVTIKIRVLPMDNCDIGNLLDQLENQAKAIVRYEAHGEKYIAVVNFLKYQNPHIKEKPSELPPPPIGPMPSACPVPAPCPPAPKPGQASGEPSSGPADSGFLIPNSGFLIPENPGPGPHSEKEALPPPEERPVPANMDQVKITAARELAARYFAVVTSSHGTKDNAKNAIIKAWDAYPRLSKTDFEKAIDNYAKQCTNKSPDVRWGPSRFFTQEAWTEFIDWKPPDAPTTNGKLRYSEAERQAMLGKKPPEKPP